MPFDFALSDQRAVQRQKAGRGLVSHLKGLAGEDSVVSEYLSKGCRLLERRWRGKAGEIDLIFAFGATVVFVEVKASANFAQAASHLSSRQIAVISSAIDEYLGQLPTGSLTEIRFDLAMVDAKGRKNILENALAG
jgi:putative endonuclease